MEHIYQNLDGWFTFPNLYDSFVEKMEDGSKMAEVGVWKGKSLSYIGVQIKNLKKDIKIYAVDTWQKMETENYHNDEMFLDDAFYNEFLKTIEPIKDLISPVRATSTEASKQFSDEYFDIVFLDACHDYEYIKQDIIHWLPKVKNGGIFAGHDIGFPGVKKAVEELMVPCYPIRCVEECWVTKIVK